MTETSGHEKGGPEPAFFVSVRGQSESGAESNGNANHRVVQKHADIELRRYIENVFEVDIATGVDAEVKVVAFILKLLLILFYYSLFGSF